MKKTASSFSVNFGLLIGGFVMAFSGLLIQVGFHMGNHGSIFINKTILGLNYFVWSNVHTISSIFILILMIIHIIQYRKWYIIVFKKKLFAKNRQVLILTLIFIIVAITGCIPWIIKLSNGDPISRKTFIEIHDKFALILFVYLIIHVVKRFKWYFN